MTSLSCFSVLQPKIVEALLGYELVQVSCGASHVLAVTNEREVFAWGRGDNGTVNGPVVVRLTSCSVYVADLWQRHLSSLQPERWVSVWQVASGWAPKTPTTVHSRCVYLWNLRPRGWCVEWTAPWSSAHSRALWPAEATGTFFSERPKKHASFILRLTCETAFS